MIRPTRARVIAALVVVSATALPIRLAAQAQPTLALDVDATSAGNPVALTRPASGLVNVGLVYTGTAAATAGVLLSPLTSDAGSVLADLVDCANPATVLKQPHDADLKPNSVLRLCLRVPSLQSGAKYTGRLIASIAGAPPFIRAMTLSAPSIQQGTLVLDRSAVVQTVRRSWFRPSTDSEEMQVSVTLREKTGAVALDGLSVRLEQVTAPESGFDLTRNAHFAVNGQSADDLTRLPAPANAALRTIAAGGQAEVTIRLHDLEPGDYIATLRFAASNSAADDTAQRLQLTIHVRDSVVRALLCLVAALLLSFTATKVLTSQRRRATLLQQVQTLQPAWFATLQPIAPVVWIQAVLHKAQRLSKKFWLTSPELIEQSIAGVRSTLTVLDSARQLRDKLNLTLDALVFRRVVLSLDRVLAGLGTGGLDDATLQVIKTQLAGFDDWLSNERFPTIFWSDIAPSLQAIQGQIVVENVPDAAKELITELKTAVDAALATPPTKRADVEKAYQQYAKLRILWEQRDDVAALLGPAKSDLTELFRIADGRRWQQLTAMPLTIRMPVANDPDGLEAYDTLQFSIETGDTTLDHSYLFRHKVEYHWTFTLQPALTFAERRGLKRRPDAVVLTPVTLGPSIVQYFPRAGTVRVAATLVHTSGKKELAAVDGPTIHPSSDYAVYRILAGGEVYSWLLAALLAIATGLSTYYFKGSSWGTYQDYLTLFLWGVGVDQGKNFLQALQLYSSAPGTTAH